jgi:glutaryl-CoA dehydrogenase (non-decarboxylating)
VDLSTNGVTRGDIHGKTGGAREHRLISFQDVQVPADNRLGEEGEGFKITMSHSTMGAYGCPGATGIIRACLDASVSYAKTRTTFGKSLGEHQLIQDKIARMSQDYEVARLLYLQAGWLQNMGRRCTRQISYAKKFAQILAAAHDPSRSMAPMATATSMTRALP